MKPTVLLDYQLAVSAGQYVVRALLRLDGVVPGGKRRIPLNLSVVLDRSGSMSGGKLHSARLAASLLVRRLHPEDVVSVVAYDDEVETIAPPATGAAQADLPARIRAIESRSTTNLSGGWLRGESLVAANVRTGAMNRILLLTDGQANVGISDPGQLAALAGAARARGITTTTIGFGADYNEHLLRAMADQGGGHTYYIERPEQAPGIFEEEIEGLLSLSAQNVSVEVRPAPTAQMGVVHHDYPSHRTAQGIGLDLGDLYAREPKRLLVEFAVPALADTMDVLIAELVVQADVLTEDRGVERQTVTLPIRASLNRAGCEEPEVQREVLLVGAARAREAALREQARGDYAAGARVLRAAASLAATLPGDLELSEEAADLAAMADRFSSEQVTAYDTKYLNQRSYNTHHSKGRSSQRISRSRPPGNGPGAIQYHVGDATRPRVPGRKIIALATDDAGRWGYGFARVVTSRWAEPQARYQEWQRGGGDGEPCGLGAIQLTRVEPDTWVLAMVTNGDAGGGAPSVQYDALERSLARLGEEALRTGASVHMPRIACGDAGGRWDRIERMVDSHVSQAGVPVYVYDLP